jgi:hypothetical protein
VIGTQAFPTVFVVLSKFLQEDFARVTRIALVLFVQEDADFPAPELVIRFCTLGGTEDSVKLCLCLIN